MNDDQLKGSNLKKDPEEWKTGDEPATDSQKSYIETVASETKEEVSTENLTKADSGKLIGRLQEKTAGGRTKKSQGASKISYKFCPHCGHKANRFDNRIECPNCGRNTFVNSIPTVGIFIIQDGKVLLSKRGIDPKKGFYDFIGGFLEQSEHPKKGALRETLEESGLTIKIVDFLGIYINNDYRYQGVKVYPQDTVYIANIIKGKINPQDDVASLDWFPISKPPKNIAFRSVTKALKDLKKWHRERKS